RGAEPGLQVQDLVPEDRSPSIPQGLADFGPLQRHRRRAKPGKPTQDLVTEDKRPPIPGNDRLPASPTDPMGAELGGSGWHCWASGRKSVGPARFGVVWSYGTAL